MALHPKVSVIIPHYNMHALLPGAVASVARQSYDNIELIIVDDGSEQPVSVKQRATAELALKVVEIAHGGKPKAVNRGLQEATGSFVAILDADDRLPKDSLLQRTTAMKQAGADLCIGSFEVWYDGRYRSVREVDQLQGLSRNAIVRKLLTDIIAPLHQNAMLMKWNLVERAGSMDPQMIRGQDKDFAVRLLKHSTQTAFIADPVYIYNRYDRPFFRRIHNRMMGLRFKLKIIKGYVCGWRRITYLGWALLVGAAKWIHDLFGIYKR